ncbi:MAG: PD-(D/E)XK nuclease family protein [Candidatus Nanopelagicaceae bacterium]
MISNGRAESTPRWALTRTPTPPFPRDPISDLHRAVLETSGGRSRFVSGVNGSGKTTLLIQRALALLAGELTGVVIDPARLLVLTFSRSHADFLRDRIAINASTIAREPIARTFAALAFSIVRMALEEDVREPILLSGAEQDQMMRTFLTSEFEVGNWPDDLSKALATRGFAKELRDLISRAKERGLSYQALESLGREIKDPNWIAAARFWKRMEEIAVIRESGVGDPKERIDPSELISRAALYLERSSALRDRVSNLFDHVLIDHFEEGDPSHRRLLRAISPRAVTIFFDKASAVSTFRGADPDGIDAFIDEMRSERDDLESTIDLGATLRHSPNAMASESESIAQEARVIAEYLRIRHLRDEIEWREMAVIVRSPGEHLSTIRRTLALSNIPVFQERGTTSLAESSAIKPMIMIAEIALGTLELRRENFDKVSELLLSEFGGLDPLRLRRLREEINRLREEGDLRSTDEIILTALSDREVILDFDPRNELKPLADLLRRATKVARLPQSTITDLLWEIWNTATDHSGDPISEKWRDRVIESNSLYEVGAGDRDLDLVVELFEVARRFTERFPFASAALFLEELKSTTIFGDVIAPQSDSGNRVTLTTVHSAKGSQPGEWKVVVIAGVQEGIWPNLTTRGSLLGSERLVEIQRYGILPKAELAALSATALAIDEKRLFEYATSRASEHLLVTAVTREDDLPSPYFYDFAARNPSLDEADAPLSPLPMIAHLRRQLMDEAVPRGEREGAASMLKRLAREGFVHADASKWLGFNSLTTTYPLIEDGHEIPISPSEIDRFIECQLRWFLEKSGARDGDSQAALLGSAIHAYAQLLAEGEVDLAEARSRLERTWHLIDSSSGWSHTHQLQRAIRILERFVDWQSSNDRKLIATEAKLDLEVEAGAGVPIRIRGSADRIEIDENGKFYIVDLKTSSSQITAEEAKANLQLAIYQTGLALGGFEEIGERDGDRELGGAELVYPASKTKSVATREQPPIDPDVIAERVGKEAVAMAGPSFIATINSSCRTCAVRTLCPMQGSGRSVVRR